ncbi:MAG: septal ring lytic transglycosylase RlpA family protein [Acidimicrobiia bacterium]|nr:septal ring lytic transglycosylase RlpA family protein [Acidimicrobiia bacterium]
MRRHLIFLVVLLSSLIGPSAHGATPVENALALAELRVERQALYVEVEAARLELDVITRGFDLTRRERDDVLVAQAEALEKFGTLERSLRAARALLDEGIQQAYIRSGSAAATVVMFFDDPTEAGIATHYLEAVSASQVEPLQEVEALMSGMDEVRHAAFDAAALADADYAQHERLYISATGRLADLEFRLARLDDRIDRLATEWSGYRLGLALDILESTGATGILESDTITQAELRASLPLGPTIGIPPGLASTGRSLSGIASWYGPGFHGRRSSSGAIFDERDFTIAHKTLPHETLLLVTYGDRQAVVMVNDRGPFIEGREFDLSRATAEYLGVGLNKVKVEVLTLLP